MYSLDQLPTPALLVDLEKLETNIEAMQRRCEQLGVRLRPHVKSHKCVPVARLQRDAGADGITVSTLFEAETFAAAGFDDITWAFPLILSRLDQATDLARRVRLGVVVDSPTAIDALASTGHRHRVWIKVDCGYHRAGVDPDSDAAVELAAQLRNGGLDLAGLLSHSGDAYDHTTLDGRAAVAERERRRIVAVATRLRDAGFEVPEVSVGSTPGMTAARDLTGVTEGRPGNYVYFDLMQADLGSCAVADCALTVLASVVSSGRGHSILDAGALALSKDPGLTSGVMGALFADSTAGTLDDAARLVSLSQEHGKVSAELSVGARVRVLPNHSCLAAACFTDCYAVRGDRVVEHWPVANGR